SPIVAGGRHDDDACVDCGACGQRQRIEVVGLIYRGRDRQVDHPDVPGVLPRDGVADPCNDIADPTLAGPVEHLQLDQPDRRRDARSSAARIEAAAAHNAGDVCAMTVIVVRRDAPVDEVDEMIDARATSYRIGEIVEGRGGTGVDDRDADAGAV